MHWAEGGVLTGLDAGHGMHTPLGGKKKTGFLRDGRLAWPMDLMRWGDAIVAGLATIALARAKYDRRTAKCIWENRTQQVQASHYPVRQLP